MRSVGPQTRMPGVVYQSDDALDRYVSAGLLTDETLTSAFRDVAARFPDRVALSSGSWLCTYGELDQLTDKAGSAFRHLGLNTLDRVIFQLVNTPELVIAWIGCLKAGLIPICTLAAHRALEIGYIGRHAAARAHIVQGDDPKFDFAAFSLGLRSEIPTLEHTIVAQGNVASGEPGLHSLQLLIAAEEPEIARRELAAIELDPFQVALFQLSGGTTGVPKIIPRFHNEYLYAIRCMMAFQGLDETTVAYSAGPMMHNAPMACIWGPALFAGGEVATCQTADPAELGPYLAARRPNWLFVPPPVLLRLADAGWLKKIDFAGASFSVASGAAKIRSLIGGASAWPLFGMTEGLLCYGGPIDPIEAITGTNGRPISDYDEVKLLAPETEQPIADGEIGELVVRGPSTIRGYYDAQDRNQVAFTSDGFYRSGDLMRIRVIEGRRYLIFEGRVKDVVDRGGEKINCEEVERICVAHPAIAAVAIVGMPDPRYGERACAFIIAAKDAPKIDCRTLGLFLQSQGMAKFKWPERIEFVTEFPTTSSGKLSKPKLKDAIRDILKREAVDDRAIA